MACIDCLNNCGDTLTSDKCVKYTGPDIECLDICTGDSLYEVLQALQIKVCDSTILTTEVLDITGVCTFMSNILGTDTKTTENLIQALVTGVCSLNDMVVALQTTINTPLTLNTNCLTLPASPTRDDILKAVVTLLCSVSVDVAAIKADYVKATQLNSLIATYLQSIGISTTPSTSLIQENSKMPKYVAMPYHGTLSVFDASGAGLSAFGYSKVYMCVGQTIGTFVLPDYRGRSPIGANNNVPQANIDSDVTPSNSNNLSIAINTKQGQFKYSLQPSENALHAHTITDPGHTHNVIYKTDLTSGNSGNNIKDISLTPSATVPTSSNVTGITATNTSGLGSPHLNTHPVIGSCFIMFIP